jgi:PAS domain S-box-containing protein
MGATRVPPTADAVIVEHLADAVIAQEPGGRVVYANEAARVMFGITLDTSDWTGDPHLVAARFETWDEQDRPLAIEALPGRRVLRGESPARTIVRWRRRDGGERDDERWTEVQARPVRGEDGQVQLAISIIRDVTAERRAVRRLALLTEAGAKLSATLDVEATLRVVARLPLPQLGDWCVVQLLDGEKPRRAGAHGEEGRQALLDRLLAGLAEARRVPDLPAEVRAGRAARVIGPGADQVRALFAAQAGEAALAELGIPAALLTTPLLVRGQVVGAITVAAREVRGDGADALALLADLAQRAALAVDNARVYQAAQAASDLRRDLLAVVAHDLKNPLNAISMAAALLARSAAPDNDRQRRQANIVARAADRMNRLIHDLLDVNAIDAGRMELEPAPVALGPLLQEALEAMAPLAQEKSIVLERNIAPGDEGVEVRADRERLLQVFSNLVGNAIKYVPEHGHIRISACRRGADRVELAVTDDGPGIAPEHLPHIFDRYWRVRTSAREGTGLGLSIVKGIVEAHGGTVAVDTAPGRGATFAVTLPLGGPPLPNVYNSPTGA